FGNAVASHPRGTSASAVPPAARRRSPPADDGSRGPPGPLDGPPNVLDGERASHACEARAPAPRRSRSAPTLADRGQRRRSPIADVRSRGALSPPGRATGSATFGNAVGSHLRGTSASAAPPAARRRRFVGRGTGSSVYSSIPVPLPAALTPTG